MPAGRHHSLHLNALANWCGFAAQVAVAFVMAPLLLRHLGDTRYGTWLLVESMLAYLMLFDLGVAAAVVRYVARFESTRDHDQVNRVASTCLTALSVAGLIAFVPAVGLCIALPWLGVPTSDLSEARGMLLVLGLNLALGLPLSVYPCVLEGLGRYPVRAALRTLALIVRTVAFVTVLHANGGLIALAGCILVSALIESLTYAVAAHRYLPALRATPWHGDWATWREIRGTSTDALTQMIAGRVAYQSAALLIGAILGAASVPFFALAARLTDYARQSFRTLTTVLMPAVSSWQSVGDLASVRRVYLNASRGILWLVLPAHLGLLILGRPFLTLWLGDAFAAVSYPVLLILAGPLSLVMSQSVSARVLYGLGRSRRLAQVSVVEASLNLILGLMLIPSCGLNGMAAAVAVPEFLASGFVAVYACQQLTLTRSEYVQRVWTAPLLTAVVPAVLWLALVEHATSWATLLIVGGVGVVPYAVVAVCIETGVLHRWWWTKGMGSLTGVRS